MLRITRHRKAKRDLLETYVYLGERNMDAAERFLRAVDEDLKRLSQMPNIGARRESDDPRLQGVRTLPVSGFRNYLLFYRPTDTELQLLRVIHGARDLESALFD
jgi:toxin ParE1/3/4